MALPPARPDSDPRRASDRPPPQKQRRDARASFGALGEQLAARALAQRGYRVVARNLRTRTGELDLLVRRRRTWIAVEVKTRRDHPAPERCVSLQQLERLARTLRALAPGLRPRPRALRIDVVTVRVAALADGRIEPLELRHFPGFHHVAAGAHDIASSRSAAARAVRTPTYQDRDPSVLLPMPVLSDQLIPRRKLMLLASETLVIMAVLLIGTSVPPLTSRSFVLTEFSSDLWHGLLTSFTVAIICQASLSYNDLYDWKVAQNRAELANRLLHSCGYSLVMLGFLSLVAGSIFVFPGLQNINGETWKLIVLVCVAYALLFVYRHAFHWFFYKWRSGERVVVLGSSQEALNLARMIRDTPMAGYEVYGLIEEVGQPPLDIREDDPPLLGGLETLNDRCRKEGISRVVVALRERRGKVPVDALLHCRMDGVIIEEREAMYERLTGKLAVESMRPSYLIYGRGFAKDPLTMSLKRVLDILASTLGIVLSLPICVVTAIAVKLTSRGPIFFVQKRVGEDGEPFPLIKFRTMKQDAERESGPVWAQKNDDRITPIGKFLRLTRIDEIPQFLNILSGQMSFVGPRPERPHFVDQLQKEIPFYPLRHAVKPGLTGWAQVCHPYGASTEDAQEKLRYDLYYIKNMGLMFDLSIMARTVAVILRGKGAR